MLGKVAVTLWVLTFVMMAVNTPLWGKGKWDTRTHAALCVVAYGAIATSVVEILRLLWL